MAGISSTEHFVDKHRVELIRRVTNVTPILDALLSNDVINKESYNNIRSIPDPQDKMRALFRGPLESSGVKGKEIFYQILNKCCPHLISDLKKQCSVMDTVETMTVKKVLRETLNHLSSEEFEKFKFFLKMHKDSPTTTWSQLKVANIQDTVKLMVETYSEKCVKVAKEILQKMNMTGLVQRLSDTSLRTKEKHTVDEQESPLIQRVATLASAIELLLETLSDLSDKELEEFKVSLQRQTGGCRHYSSMEYGAWRLLMIRDMQDTVFLMVLDDGRRSVETTKKLLEKMKRTDLVRRLSDSSSKPKKKRSDEHLPALIHKVATMRAVKELLLETLGYLSDEEFRWSLQFTFFKMSLPLISWRRLMRASTMTLLDLMMEMCGQHALKVAKELLMGIKRTDMVQKLSQTSSGHKAAGSSAHPFGASTMRGEKHFDDEYWPALVQKVETMTSIIELLLETMADLSDDLLLTLTNNGFKYTLLTQTDFYKHFSDMQMFLMNMKDRKDIVFLIVLIYSEQSMETMKKVLEKMKKTDLVQRLSDSSLRSKKRHLDEQQSALIHKIATMAAVKQLLWETLNDLSDRELDKFKEFLQLTVSQKDLTDISSTLSYITDKAKIVAEMVMTYGQQSVQLTAEVVKKMNRADLMHRLSKPSLKFKDKHSVDERQPAPWDKAAAKSAVKRILVLTFKYLSTEELEKFKLLLQFTYFKRGLPQISWRQLEWAEKAETLVDLMVQTCSQQPVDVAMEVFMDMNRTDLVHRLSVINSSLKVKLEPSKKEVSMSPVMQRLLGTLKDLNDKDLGQLKWLLQHFGMKKDEQNFLGRRIEKAGRVEIAELMEELYGLWSMKMIREFLKEVGRTDLVQRLTEISSGSKGQRGSEKKWMGWMEDEGAGTSKDPPTVKKVYGKKTWTVTGSEISSGSKGQRGSEKKWMGWMEDEGAGTSKDPPTVKKVYGKKTWTVTGSEISSGSKGQRGSEKKWMGWMEDEGAGTSKDPPTGKKVYGKKTWTVTGSGPLGGLESERCESITQDPSDWTKLEPEVTSTEAHEAPTYSLQSKTGNFECSVSGLHWVCKEKVSFKYQFCSLDVPMMRLEMMQYMPAGPLMDITVIAGKFDEVYLPHWICIDDNPTILDKFAVLHIDDCGDAVEKVSEVTSSHVKLSEPVFSLKMVLVKYFGLSVEIYCKVLIYYKMINAASSRMSLTLHVYLIPPDPGLQQHLDKMEISHGYKEIRKPKPEKPLKMHNWFKLTTDLDGADIYPQGEEPQTIMLRYDSTDPNFYEVVKKNPNKDFKLTLTPKNGHQPVWTCEIQKGEYQNTGRSQETAGQSSKRGPRKRKRSANKQQKAAIAANKARLLEILQDLNRSQFEVFKWHLENGDIGAGLRRIQSSDLENSNRLQLVDLMVHTYTQRSVEVAKKVLEEIGRNDLVQRLSDTSSGSEAAGSSS